MPRLLAPASRPPFHRRRFSDGARGLVVGMAMLLAAVWMVTIVEQVRVARGEMRDLDRELGRFTARAAAAESAALRRW